MTKKLPSVKTIPKLKGKRVLLRASLNVPVENGVVTNSFRIKRALPTITYLRQQEAKVIVIAHIGRKPDESLAPVHAELAKLVDAKWSPQLTGPTVQEAVTGLAEGEVLILENIRQDVREKENDSEFAEELAALADVYVNDAFAASHRSHASLVGIPRFLPSYFGFNFIHEYEELNKAREPEHPSLFILGGAKFETKLPLVEKYADTYDQVMISGALANDIYKAKGYEVGVSLVSDIDLHNHSIIDHKNVFVPDDVTVKGPNGVRVTAADAVEPDENILDAGPAAIEALASQVAAAKMILWNGPLGNFEAGFGDMTRKLAQLIAAAPGYSIVGGGDTIAAIEDLGVEEQFNFLSTAGGAMLAFLETGTLPAIDAVMAYTES